MASKQLGGGAFGAEPPTRQGSHPDFSTFTGGSGSDIMRGGDRDPNQIITNQLKNRIPGSPFVGSSFSPGGGLYRPYMQIQPGMSDEVLAQSRFKNYLENKTPWGAPDGFGGGGGGGGGGYSGGGGESGGGGSASHVAGTHS